jgi:ketosteroid isomerase-like protein
MADVDDVLSAAWQRAEAMADNDETRLRELLHPDFGWISHKGDWFDLKSYLESNQRGSNTWHRQELRDAEVRVVGDTGVVRCIVVDTVDVGSGRPEEFTMPMTQTWVRESGRWRCLAGHAGPRITNTGEETTLRAP